MIKYLIGNATEPISSPALITHICNNVGAWGAGFVVALSKINKIPEIEYSHWSMKGYYENKKNEKIPFELGQIQICYFKNNTLVANMIAQEGIYINNKGIPPIRYESLRQCLTKVNFYIEDIKQSSKNITIHMPRIGAGLAGGYWNTIEGIIEETLTECDVFVYTLQHEINKFPKANYVY